MAYYKFCEQCGTLYLAERETSKFCTVKCRMRNHRGTDFTPAYETKAEHAEQVLRVLAQQSPRAFDRLSEIKAKYGQWALLTALDAIEEIVKMSKPNTAKARKRK